MSRLCLVQEYFLPQSLPKAGELSKSVFNCGDLQVTGARQRYLLLRLRRHSPLSSHVQGFYEEAREGTQLRGKKSTMRSIHAGQQLELLTAAALARLNTSINSPPLAFLTS